MQPDLEDLIKRTAARVRARDFLWSLGIGGGILLAIELSGLAMGRWTPIAVWAVFSAALAIRYLYASGRAWAEPVRAVIESQMDAQRTEIELLRLARDVAEALPEPLFILDAEGAIELANPAAQEFLGVADVTGRHFSTVMRAPAVFDAVKGAEAGRPAQVVDFTHVGALERFCRAFVAPLGGAAGETARVLVYVRDLTGEKRVEQMRVDFIASASHELRTPLASVLGYIETLQGSARDDPEAQTRFLKIMQAQAERMQRLVADLMSLSRIELQEHVRPDGRVDLCTVAKEQIEGLAPLLAQTGTKVAFDCPCGGPVQIRGDRDQIAQVAQNLLDNAAKYGGKDAEVVVTVGRGHAPAYHAESAARSGDTLDRLAARMGRSPEGFGYLQVRDQGQGIARGDLPRLTERFYRVSAEQSRKVGGTGLGLAIVKHIVNRHKGGMLVESAVGHGAAFTCFFPLAE